MLHATARYQVWRQPGSGVSGTGSGRWKPLAEQVRPLTPREVAAAQDQMAWFRAELARPTPCFTPQAWQTLDDVLHEVPYAAVAARDGIAVKHARQRSARLLRFLRSHIARGETTCQEERRKRTYGVVCQVALATVAATAD